MINKCAVDGWDVIASSSLDSQLAGVLAGFIFTGIILLLGLGGAKKNVQALGIFCPSFIVLAFDSHLWGVINGESTTIAVTCGTRRWQPLGCSQ